MTDAKEIFTAVLDDPPPPPPPGAQVIRRARRVMRRAWLVRAGLAAAVVAAVVLAVPRIALDPTPAEPAEPTLTPTQMSDTSGLIERFATVITAALPPDVVVQPGGAVISRDPHTGELTMVDVPVDVERSGEHGRIIAFWRSQPGPAPSGGLCTAPWPDSLLAGGTDRSCATIDVSGTAVRVGVRTQPTVQGRLDVLYAIHYLDGAVVLVAELPVNDTFVEPRPILTSPILTQQQLAELATDWRLTPFVAPPPG